jgi:hypothetical protein
MSLSTILTHEDIYLFYFHLKVIIFFFHYTFIFIKKILKKKFKTFCILLTNKKKNF